MLARPPAEEPSMRAFLLSLMLLLAVVPAARAQALPGLVEGRDYRLVEGGAPYRNAPGKVEVAEVFAYWCPHCFRFEPMLQAWKRRLPASVRFVAVPMVAGPDDALGRAFFAAEAAGALPVLHGRLFDAIHRGGELPQRPDAAQVAAFVAGVPGIDHAAFRAAWGNDAGLRARMAHAYQFALRSDVPGTPSLVIDGRYLVLGNSYDALLANADRVLAALAARRAPPPAAAASTP
jgi:thiol:disulfide interchange protein DsbA